MLEAYRALARSAVERTLLDDLPGRTAARGGGRAGAGVPGIRRALATAADAFDAVRYGRRAARPESARDVIALDAALAAHPAGAARPGHRGRCAMTRHHRRRPGAAQRRGPAGTGTRVRRTAAFVGVVVLGPARSLGLLGLSAQRPTADLDPEGTGPEGARALAEVLRQQGVDVEVVRSIDALEAAEPDADTTVFVGDPTDLGPGAAARLADAARLGRPARAGGVDSEQLELLGLPVEAFGGGGNDLVAGCVDSEVARPSDVVSVWDTRYLLTDDGRGGQPRASWCRRRTGRPTSPTPTPPTARPWCSSTRTAAHPDTVVAGLGPAWANEIITDDSHAGTAVRALGSTPRLVWYQPGDSDALAPGPGDIDAAGRPVGLAAVDRPGHRPAAGRRRAPRAGPGPPARPPRARAAARRGARHRDHREPRPPLPPGRRPGPRGRRAARPAPPTGSPSRLAVGRGAGPDAVVHAASRGHRATGPARWLTSCSGPPRPTTPP